MKKVSRYIIGAVTGVTLGLLTLTSSSASAQFPISGGGKDCAYNSLSCVAGVGGCTFDGETCWEG